MRAIEVVEMKQASFRNFRQHFRQVYTERNQDEMNKPLDFQKIVWFNFGRGEKLVNGQLVEIDHPKVVWVRKTYEEPRIVSFF